METVLLEGERIDDLQVKFQNDRDLVIIQNPNFFCFGIDAVILANFTVVKKGDIILDMGTGCGIIPLLIGAKTQASHITGIEIQQQVAEMAKRSVIMNGLQDKINILNLDFKEYYENDKYDIITCNPPYKENGGGLINPNSAKALARHEICCTLTDVIKTATRLLKVGGKLNLIHRPERLADIICLMRENRLEPKTIQYVQSRIDTSPTMVLISATKHGRPKIITKPPIILY